VNKKDKLSAHSKENTRRRGYTISKYNSCKETDSRAARKKEKKNRKGHNKKE